MELKLATDNKKYLPKEVPAKNQFRIIVGSYEHNILCVSLDLSNEQIGPIFTPIFHFQAHSLSVRTLDASKKFLVSGSSDEHIRIYDMQNRTEMGNLLSHEGTITCLKFSKKSFEEDIINNEKLENGKKLGTNSSDGKWLLSASEDKTITVWRTKDWEKFAVLKGHTKRINDIDIHPSNRVAISISDDHSIRLWNLMSMKKAGILKLKDYNQNGQYIRWLGLNNFVVGLTSKILVYDISLAKVCYEIDTPKRSVIMHLEVDTIDGKDYVIVGLNDGSLFFYAVDQMRLTVDVDREYTEEDFKNLLPEFTLNGHSNRIKSFKYYKNKFAEYLVSCSSDGRIVCWDLKTKEKVCEYDTSERLNCLTVIDESVEKMKVSTQKLTNEEEYTKSELEDELNSEDEAQYKKIMKGTQDKKRKRNKGGKKVNKKRKVEIEL
jgi:protein MAK11